MVWSPEIWVKCPGEVAVVSCQLAGLLSLGVQPIDARFLVLLNYFYL